MGSEGTPGCASNSETAEDADGCDPLVSDGEFDVNTDLLVKAYKTTTGYCGSNIEEGEYAAAVYDGALAGALDTRMQVALRCVVARVSRCACACSSPCLERRQ